MKVIYHGSTPLLSVREPKIGELYHCSWARKKGMVWKCIAINEQDQTVTLITPKTKILLSKPVKIIDLRYTRAEQTRINIKANRNRDD